MNAINNEEFVHSGTIVGKKMYDKPEWELRGILDQVMTMTDASECIPLAKSSLLHFMLRNKVVYTERAAGFLISAHSLFRAIHNEFGEDVYRQAKERWYNREK